MAATFNKFQSFVEALAEKKHNLGADTLKYAFSNATNAPSASVHNVLSDITCIDATNLGGNPTLLNVTSAQSAGTYKLDADDMTLTATGAVPAFRYVILYNDSAASKELIGWWDYGSEITLASGETFKIAPDAAGILTIA